MKCTCFHAWTLASSRDPGAVWPTTQWNFECEISMPTKRSTLEQNSALWQGTDTYHIARLRSEFLSSNRKTENLKISICLLDVRQQHTACCMQCAQNLRNITLQTRVRTTIEILKCHDGNALQWASHKLGAVLLRHVVLPRHLQLTTQAAKHRSLSRRGAW